MSVRFLTVFACLISGAAACHAQQLEQQLLAESASVLARDAKANGDAARGAIVFHQPHMACATCHSVDPKQSLIGPTLAVKKNANRKTLSDVELIDAVLRPSKKIDKAYQTLVVLTNVVHSGFLVREDDQVLVLREVSQNRKQLTIPKAAIEMVKEQKTSMMPAGQVNQLSGRQQFLDLAKYLMEIRDGGPGRALQLQPPAHLLVAPPIPEYETTIDHAGMIADMNGESRKRGEAIYTRLCINCHGTKDKPGSLPNSLRFATGKFKNGSDPYAMYQTLTRGFGMMLPQTWMVPQQKYDVINYVRHTYLAKHNPSQHFQITKDYLASLPKGDSRGPAPSNVEAWVNMDYGPSMINSFEHGSNGKNFAYKGIASRLDAGPGGVSRGNAWMIFDHDTMRVSAAWTKPEASSVSPFIDWQGIHFNGRHNIHPRLSGEVHLSNPSGPGWANPRTGSFDDPRLVGRDNRKYGPLPNDWARLHGIYSHGSRTVVSYQIGATEVAESAALLNDNDAEISGRAPTFARLMNIGPREKEMTLLVATVDPAMVMQQRESIVTLQTDGKEKRKTGKPFSFNGGSYGENLGGGAFNMHDKPFTVIARVRTKSDGAIFTKTANAPKWVPNGQSLFIRGGQLCYDVGWVGAVKSKRRVADGKWHDVAMTWDPKSTECSFYVDGKPSGGGKLRPKALLKDAVVRVGFTAANFPAKPYFDGELRSVQFVQRVIDRKELVSHTKSADRNLPDTVALWPLEESLADSTAQHDLVAVQGESKLQQPISRMVAGLSVPIDGAWWSLRESGRLCLTIPAGKEPLRFALWTRSGGHSNDVDSPDIDSLDSLAGVQVFDGEPDLSRWTKGGPPRWPERLTTTVVRGEEEGPFATDTLVSPSANPWQARLRFTGHDFFADGDRMAVCAWDGDVWLVSGLTKIDAGDAAPRLTWQRVASGLFQPLGLKIVDGEIYVSCRDQICILKDFNGDGETDFYQCFNRDHQVTEHFHEFAMGLQRDADGNFYYAKSARHAKTAVVPHHGTLLRVSPDGSKTDILANGFRAANGVCLNPDGTFIVTDQEGHWNPKNRINWVQPGGFYGNMFGYHDVSDSSDSAMSQPLCWITNAFDRSPAELLWVDSEKWGPLNKRLLNLSYGYGKVYVVPHEDVDGQKQGGMIQLPIPQFPTGTMRGRFRKEDGQLYVCGMFAWAGSQQKEGGLYRIRRTEAPVHLPVELSATKAGMTLGFTDRLDRESAEDPDNFAIKVWSLKRTANYGSKHYDEHSLAVDSATLSADGKTLTLAVPEIAATWCMEIRYKLNSASGHPVSGTIHNTIHSLRDESD